ncbi:MAG: hypothetical protein MI749_11875, partial [Desulfovibrionales bacterium]|nr:hypothetical protein [Desulfovibrionales bacterium]
STWDYQHHPRAFWALLESIQARGVVLENPLDLMGWNMDKTYLRELETLGIGIVPTLWGRGDPPPQRVGTISMPRAASS